MLSKNVTKFAKNICKKDSSLQRCYCTAPVKKTDKIILRHPYRKIHPWTSIEKFANSLVDGVIYNEGGLVAINKPYGISGRDNTPAKRENTGIVDMVPYTLTQVLPHLAESLGFESLKIIRTPEKYTSGVTLLAANDKMERLVNKAMTRAQGLSILPRTYWAVTTRVPNSISGENKLAIQKVINRQLKITTPIIVTRWSHNQQKRRDIKILSIQYKTISNSTDNLASLLEMRTSTAAFHAQRLFAATVLYAPILGDRIFGSRVKNVLGKWMNISPFVDAAFAPPVLNTELSRLIKIHRGKQDIIPVHLHLREMFLPMFPQKHENLTITAPPMPEFMWTCKRLKFKHELFEDPEMKFDPRIVDMSDADNIKIALPS